jgi:hypothetical protein
MAFSDVLIELLSFSKVELAGLADTLDLKLPAGDRIEQAQWLADQTTMPKLREVAEEYLGSGRSALSWVMLRSDEDDDDEEGGGEELVAAHLVAATGAPVTLDEVTAALVELTGKADPWKARLRPDVTTEPQLVNAQHETDSDLVFFTLVYERASGRRIVRDWKFQSTPEDAFLHVVLRLSRGVIEVRAEGRLAKKVTNGWVTEFAEALGREPQRLLISYQDVEELWDYLSAKMDRHDARHENEDAGYGRQSVTASVAHPDLLELDRFKDDFDGSDPVQSDLLIDYADAGGQNHEIRVRISTAQGTVRCVNHVSNDVMEYIYDAFRAVREARVTALAMGQPKQS